MVFTVDSPTRYEYVDTRDGPAAIRAVEIEARAITRSLRDAVDRQEAVAEPSGYRITHVFQVADEEDGKTEDLQYVESMDVETWEHITSAIEAMLTRTRAEGWTVSIMVTQLNLPGSSIDAGGIRQNTADQPARG